MNDEWETPDDLYLALDKEFDFEFDLCAQAHNAKCLSWSSNVSEFAVCTDTSLYDSYWMNPPYSRKNIDSCMGAADWIAGENKTVVCLVRFDPSTSWFQNIVDGRAAEVRMLDRRVKFKGAASAYNFPCCVVVFDGTKSAQTEYFIWGWK